MMKALRVCCFIVAFWLMASCAFAISLADGYKTYSLESNSHAHVSVTSASKVYAMTVTFVGNGITASEWGFARLIQVNTQTAGLNTASEVGQHYVTTGKGLTCVKVNALNPTLHLNWPDGISCGGPLFADCQHTRAEVYYRE